MKKFTLYTKPIPINQKFFVVRGRNILSTKYRDTKGALAQETRLEWTTEPLSTPLKLTLNMYFGDKRRRDIDAYIKIILDSMEGIVYENDVQIVDLHVTKAVDKEEPRVEVVVG